MTFQADVLATSPYLYWRCDETSGAVAADTSGNGRTGAIGSQVGLNQTGLLTSDPASPAFSFAGFTGATVNRTITHTPASFGAFAMVKPAGLAAGPHVILSRQDAAVASWTFRFEGTALHLYVWRSAGSLDHVVASTVFVAGTIYAVGFACDSVAGVYRIVVNGVMVGTAAINSGAPYYGGGANTLRLGSSGAGEFYQFGSVADEVVYWDRAPSTAELLALSNSAFASPSPPPNVPTSVAVGAVDYTSAELTWAAPSGGGPVSSYQVRLDGGAPVTATSPHVFTGLDSGTAYDLEVRAVGAGGNSAWVLVSTTTTTLPEGWYRADVTVGSHSWSVEHGDTPTLGVRLPLTLGWALPDSIEYFPCQADPTRMTFGLLVDEAADLADVDRGSTVTFAMYLDPDPAAAPWQEFTGVVTQLDGRVTDAGRFRVTVYAGDDTMRLDQQVIGWFTPWPEESIGDRLDRIAAECSATLVVFNEGGLEGTLPARAAGSAITGLAAMRDALKDAASDNISSPPDEWWGRYVFSYDHAAAEITVRPFERRVYAGSTLTLDGERVPAFGDWTKLPGNAPTATWALVDGTTFGTPSGPPIVRNTALVDTLPTNPSAVTRDNLGESLLPDGSTQLTGWYSDRITYQSWLDPGPMAAGLQGVGLASLAPMHYVVPVVVTPLNPDYELNGVDYLAGTLTGAQLVLPPGGNHVVHLRLRPELLDGTDLP